MPRIDNFSLGSYRLDGPSSDEALKLVASGTIPSSSTTGLSTLSWVDQNSIGNNYSLTLSYSFGDIPKAIILKRSAAFFECLFVRDLKNSNGNSMVTVGSSAAAVTGNFYVTTAGFRLPVLGSNSSYSWEAYA